MENEQISEQLKQVAEEIKAEIKKSNKNLENKMLVYILVAAVLLYTLLK